MEQLFIGLILAAISGLVYLAYKHSSIYPEISRKSSTFILTALLLMFFWHGVLYYLWHKNSLSGLYIPDKYFGMVFVFYISIFIINIVSPSLKKKE